MEINYVVKILIYLIISAMSLMLSYHFISNGKKSFLLYSYIAFQMLIFLWAFHDIIIEIYNNMSVYNQVKNYHLNFIYIKLEFFITCFIPYCWLIFCKLYSNTKENVNKFMIVILVIPPIFFYILHATDYFVYTYFTAFDIQEVLLLLYIITCYAYSIWGIIIIIKHLLRQTGYPRKQAILLSLCTLLPFISNIIQNVRIYIMNMNYEVFGIDITLVSFALTMLMIAVAASRYRFLKTVPYAMKEMFKSMDQPVIILDTNNNVLEYNHAFINNFSSFIKLKQNETVSTITELFRDRTEYSKEKDDIINTIETKGVSQFEGELKFITPFERCYSVNIRPIFINNEDFAGKIIVFNDITRLKSMIEELNENNTELTAMNDQLKEYSATVEALAIERERNRLARDVHDTLGQSMTIINTLLKASIISCEKDVAVTKEKLSAAMTITKDGMSELRRVVTGLSPQKLDSHDLLNSIRALIRDFEVSGLNVEFNTDEIEDFLTDEYSIFIFRLCQEALTNSVRHGKAKNVTIIIQVNIENLRLFITDDGCSSKDMTKGMGLTGMEHRVGELGGSIRYGYGEKAGFNIYVELPYISTIVESKKEGAS